MTTRRLASVGLALAVVAGLVAGSRAVIQAFNPQPEPPALYYGASMVQPGEMLNVYVTNVGDPAARRHPPDPGFEISFYNELGMLVAQQVEQVPPGQTVAVSFMADGRTGRHIWAKVTLRSGDSPFISGMEMVGATGQVKGFVHPQDLVGFNPQPDPPGSPLR